MPALRTPDEVLHEVWGFPEFRPLQREAIDAVLGGGDALVVLPTGGGKSLCYQVPPLSSGRCTLVVSPLIALMDDQVAAAVDNGVRAGALHSNLDPRRTIDVRQRARAGELDLLYCSPERLCAEPLLDDLAGHIGLVAIDEAHCISHWGHDFRPEYRQLRPILDRQPDLPRMALTATATPQVRDDIVVQLGLRDPIRLVGDPDRPNLVYRSRPRRDRHRQIMEVIRRHPGEGGIVYALTRKETVKIADRLREDGVAAAAYHAGMDGDERERIQRAFIAEEVDVVCATVAFGMGIDRSNVRYVIHANAPRSIEHYQQESGRAGRDGLPADCVLLFGAQDFGMHRFLARHFGSDVEHGEGGCGACDVCLGETEALPDDEALLTAQKIISAVWRCESRFGAVHVVAVLRGQDDERTRRQGHDRLSVFGLMAEHKAPVIRAWIDQLVVQGLLAIGGEPKYPLLVLTRDGVELCKGRGEVRLSRFPTAKKKAKRDRRGSVTGDLDETGAGLFEALRAWRKDEAARRGVPPYVVFSDATLRNLAAERPADREALLAVNGIGEKKAAQYGDAVLALLSG